MANWYNNDGLLVKIGTSEAEVVRGGELNSFGSYQEIEQVIDLTTLTSSAGTLLSDSNPGVVIPKNFVVQEIVVINEVAATSSGSATLSLGLVRQSDRTTEIDNDGFIATAALATFDTEGETNVLRVGSTGAGALVGKVTSATYPGYLVANYGTAAFTAGRIKVTLRGYVRRPNPSN